MKNKTAEINKPYKIAEDNVFAQAAALTAASFVLQILLFVYRIIITRFSGAGGLGVFQLAMPYYSILASVSLSGITVAVSRLTVEKVTIGQEHQTRAVVSTALRLFLILLSICSVVTFLFPDLIAGRILGDMRTKASMLLFIPCLFLTGFENIYKAFFYGAKHIKPNIISEPTELVIRIITIFALLYLNRYNLTPERTAFFMVIGMIVSEVFSFFFLGAYYKIYQNRRDAIPQKDLKPKDSKPTATTTLRENFFQNLQDFKNISPKLNIRGEITRIAVPICASSVLMTIINSVNTILLPQRLVVAGMAQTQAVEMLGILMGMSMPLVTLPIIFISPLMNIVLPRIASAKKLGDSADLNKKIAATLQMCSFMTFPAMAVVAALGRPLCMLMYRNELAGAYVIPLMLSSGFMYIQIVTGSILNAIDKQKQLAVYNVIDGILHIICTYFFVAMPQFGVYGFMIGNFVSCLMGTILNLATVTRTVKLKFNFKNWLVLPAISGIYTGFMTHFTYSFAIRLSLPPVLAVVIAILFAILIYTAISELRGVSLVGRVNAIISARATKKSRRI